MSRRVLARPLAAATLASALVLTAPVAALAGGQGNDQGNGQGNGQGKAGTSQADSSAGKANGKAKGKAKDKAKTKGKAQGTSGNAAAGQPNGKAKGQSEAKANGQNDGKAKGKGKSKDKTQGKSQGKSQDPAGNNGTVKIAPYGEMDGIPNNTPHPGCTFQVEWYGFDEGDDVVSQVAFAMHAPTTDVGLSVDGPAEVFVGGDSATGAGTETGLDGRETYTLSFDGEPHPKQGYHVKLTVATPHSKGNDTKTKVFWVEECDTAGTADDDSTTGDSDSGTDGGSESGDESGEDSGVAGTSQDADDDGTDREAGQDSGVLGTSLSVDSSSDADAAATGTDGSAVPTGVDAGAEGSALERAGDLARSPWALLVLALGLVAGAAAVVTRRAGR
ncbi:MAG: hypothetical protein KKE65_06450 [Actinobacteria bacterium]|nr:hypothetical protein [Actinomycetota bacterium]MBU2111281.1 hypothetical protein [Actinomycetota bacterium]